MSHERLNLLSLMSNENEILHPVVDFIELINEFATARACK
jgi:hypothetical protein